MRGWIIILAALFGSVLWDLRDTPTVVSVIRKVIPGAYEANEHKAEGECIASGTVAAVLRNDGQGWYAIADADHAPVNVASVATDLHGITVMFTRPATKIRTFIVSPDEALATAGYSAGASVAMQSATILLGRPGWLGAHQVSPLSVTTARYPWSNLWVYGLMEIPCSK